MCYSANVSIGTFLFVAAGAFYMWRRNRDIDRPLALMLVFIAFMQVLEWVLWLNLGCGSINKLITAIIPVYLVLQPVVLNWIVGSWNAGWGKEWGYGLVAAAAAALMVPERIYSAVKNYGDCAHLNSSGHLVWPGVPFESFVPYIYYIALIYPILTLNNSAFAALYLLFASASHYMFGRSNKDAWPSMWCHFVNLLTVFAVLRPI
jgi:hypothetical protein